MVISGRIFVIGMLLVVLASAMIMAFWPQLGFWHWPLLGVIVAAVIWVIILALHGSEPPRLEESDDIRNLGDARWRELIRGTSKSLVEMNYRYSVRIDEQSRSDRRCFNAEVNTIRIGFIPAIIYDYDTDRQGVGYVAFVYDGRRWRGPGLPCPDGVNEAVKHAAKCIAPLATDEETEY